MNNNRLEENSKSSAPLLENYIRGTRLLELPTERQKLNFADDVAHEGSSYKYMDWSAPGVPIHFYLDPTAGYEIVSRKNNIWKALRNDGRNYSTAEYRQKFGFLSVSSYRRPFVVSLDRHNMPQSEPNMMAMPKSLSGTGVKLATEISEAGMARVTGLMHSRTVTILPRLMNNKKRTRQLLSHQWGTHVGGASIIGRIVERCAEIVDQRGDRSESWNGLSLKHLQVVAPEEAKYLEGADPEIFMLMSNIRLNEKRGMIEAMNRMTELIDYYRKIYL